MGKVLGKKFWKKASHPLLAWWKSGWWECSWTHKKARVCAIMSTWLVHIKEYVWTIGACPTTILLPDLSCIVGMHCIVGMCDKANVETMCCFHRLMCWIQLSGHLYALQGVDLGRGGSSLYRNETLTGLAQSEYCKVLLIQSSKSVEEDFIH